MLNSEMRSETTNKREQRWTILLLMIGIVLVCLVGIFSYYEYHENQASLKFPVVQKQFEQIEQLPNSIPASEAMGTVAYRSTTLGQLYRTDLPYDSVKHFYDSELSKHGFEMAEEYESYGRKRVKYSRGQYTAFVDYVGTDNPDYTFYFYISWDYL
jgi:hypothetical protein